MTGLPPAIQRLAWHLLGVVPGLVSGMALGIVLYLGLVADRAEAAPQVDLHELSWYVHVDLIDAGAGRDLAYWQGIVDSAVARANTLVEGRQGPFDRACCTRLQRKAPLATFGSPGDGRDVLDSLSDQNFFNNAGGAGSNAFLIDSITYCGGSAPAAIGCAERPSCDGNGNDDPNLWMVVTVDAFDDDVLASVTAHERGHNACLVHVAAAACQIMQASVFTPGQGTCFAASECTNFRAARTKSSSGQSCGCHTDAGAIETDGTVCSGPLYGVCSGGLCGEASGSAGVRLIAAAAPGTAAGGPPDDAIAISALSGHWSILGPFAPTADDVRALEWADDSATLFGVVPTIGDDSIVTIDPATGQILATVGALANGTNEIVSMAYDPGPTSAPEDDRLFVFEVGGSIGQLRTISPASPSTSTLLGSLIWTPAALFTGLAYDSIQGRLFAATPFGPDGLYEIDLTTCPPSPCVSNQVPGAGLFREDASLSFSRSSGLLYLVGTAFGGQRTFYDIVDPTTGLSIETLSLDTFTPAGLAAVPEPNATNTWLAGVLGVIVAYRARHKGILRSRGMTGVAIDRSRGAEGIKMRKLGWKAIGVVSVGLALATLVGCGQDDKGGAQSGADATKKAAASVAAGVEGAADAIGAGAAKLGEKAQDAAVSAGAAATSAGAAIEAAGENAAAAVDEAAVSAAAAVDEAKASVEAAATEANAAANEAAASAAKSAAGALDAAAREADAAAKALRQPE